MTLYDIEEKFLAQHFCKTQVVATYKQKLVLYDQINKEYEMGATQIIKDKKTQLYKDIKIMETNIIYEQKIVEQIYKRRYREQLIFLGFYIFYILCGYEFLKIYIWDIYNYKIYSAIMCSLFIYLFSAK
jgi:hypothetical protein